MSVSKKPLFVVGLVCLIASALVAVSLATSSGDQTAQAQLPTNFDLSAGQGTITTNGTSTEVIVSITPSDSAVAAVGATITLDSTAVQVAECVALVGLGVCNDSNPALINMQTVDPAGWSGPTDLFRLTFTSQDLANDVPINIALIEAFDVAGTLITGTLTDGNLDLALNGDVDCDGVRTVGDALIIAQAVVGLRTGATCPFDNPQTQINLTHADVNTDGLLDVGDALQVARCTVGLLDCDS